jgi:glycosyltransferase involved in cell wall biosynthesis
MSSISVVVPVYNSELSLPALVTRLHPVLRSLECPYELILVNDGSRDSSWDVVRALSLQHSFVRGINLARNYGQHNALLCGIRAAAHEVIVTMDDDLQNPPEEIPRLLAKLDEGFDVVYGTPQAESHGLLRDLASVATKLALQNVMGAEIARKVSAFRAFRTLVREGFGNCNSPYVSIDVLLTWGTSRFASIPVRCDARKLGASNYTVGKLAAHASNMITGFSTLPLQFASMLGFLMTLVGAVVFVYVIARYFLSGGSVPGFPFLACIITIFAGAQLFALGVIGEYLARMHFRVMDRPAYTVREMTQQPRVLELMERHERL